MKILENHDDTTHYDEIIMYFSLTRLNVLFLAIEGWSSSTCIGIAMLFRGRTRVSMDFSRICRVLTNFWSGCACHRTAGRISRDNKRREKSWWCSCAWRRLRWTARRPYSLSRESTRDKMAECEANYSLISKSTKFKFIEMCLKPIGHHNWCDACWVEVIETLLKS